MPSQFELQQQLLDKYGPILGGDDLRRALGYRTTAAMKKAWRSGQLKLNIFQIEGRRGLFSLSSDVASWLAAVAAKASELRPPIANPQTEGDTMT